MKFFLKYVLCARRSQDTFKTFRILIPPLTKRLSNVLIFCDFYKIEYLLYESCQLKDSLNVISIEMSQNEIILWREISKWRELIVLISRNLKTLLNHNLLKLRNLKILESSNIFFVHDLFVIRLV